QLITESCLTKAVLVQGKAVVFTARQIRASLRCSLKAHEEITDDTAQAVGERVAEFLSIRDDLAPFYALVAQDQAFAPVAVMFHGLHQPKFMTPFEAACWGVINQRIPRPAARVMKRALIEHLG